MSGPTVDTPTNQRVELRWRFGAGNGAIVLVCEAVAVRQDAIEVRIGNASVGDRLDEGDRSRDAANRFRRNCHRFDSGLNSENCNRIVVSVKTLWLMLTPVPGIVQRCLELRCDRWQRLLWYTTRPV